MRRKMALIDKDEQNEDEIRVRVHTENDLFLSYVAPATVKVGDEVLCPMRDPHYPHTMEKVRGHVIELDSKYQGPCRRLELVDA